MNIQSVFRVGGLQDVAHQSAYVYGVERGHLPPKSPDGKTYVVLDGPGRMDTIYRFRQMEGWLGEVPVTFTYLMAYRSYEYTKEIFSRSDWKTAISNTSGWLV